jgi:choline dehydrogenase-like flavoprotein
MICSLNTVDGPTDRQADVVVVGGGIAGLIVAERLSRSHRVLVLESGPLKGDSKVDSLNLVEQAGDPYRAPSLGRSRGLGGTSSIWGGALLPFQEMDFDARPDLNRPAWPVGYSALAPYLPEVERLFQLAAGPYDSIVGSLGQSTALDAPFIARYAKWPTFTHRNVATLLDRQLRSSKTLEIWVDATCTAFEFDRSKQGLRSVTAHSPEGKRLTARASHFILAAGAIESTRLLSWAVAQPNAPHLPEGCALGSYLHDHISARLAEIETDRPTELNEVAGIRIERRTMRSFRLELSPSAQRRSALPGGFAHIAFEPLAPTGFDALRNVMRGFQARRLEVRGLAKLMSDGPYLLRAAYWRLAKGQLYWPKPARYDLHVVIEQHPNIRNSISLGTKKDMFGVPLARVEWRMMDGDVDSFRGFAVCLDRFWKGSALEQVGRLRWRDPPAHISHRVLDDAGDVYHPGGSTRMGNDRRTSVVDSNLTVWDIPNLSVISTSTFPFGASANPTMTLLAFGLRLADHVSGRLSRRL